MFLLSSFPLKSNHSFASHFFHFTSNHPNVLLFVVHTRCCTYIILGHTKFLIWTTFHRRHATALIIIWAYHTKPHQKQNGLKKVIRKASDERETYRHRHHQVQYYLKVISIGNYIHVWYGFGSIMHTHTCKVKFQFSQKERSTCISISRPPKNYFHCPFSDRRFDFCVFLFFLYNKCLISVLTVFRVPAVIAPY